MDAETERMIDEFRPLMEAIVFLKNGTVDKVETPYGKEMPEGDRGPVVQRVVEMFREWPHKGPARLFVYPNGCYGASMDDLRTTEPENMLYSARQEEGGMER